MSTGLTGIQQAWLGSLFQLGSIAQAVHRSQQFLEIPVSVPIAFLLKVKMVMAELVADNLPKDF
ncbi:hypothetical protein DAT300_15760 [Streptococcus suis]|nr:hypothetical protein DAT300_15760 [Streptococcus suis]